MGLRITHSGGGKTEAYLRKMESADIFATLERFGQMGVNALASATPVEAGATAEAWTFEIVKRRGYFAIHWMNPHKVAGVPLAILLQYGHGTRQGGYVQGRDFINPAIRPIFDQIDAEFRKAVSG